MKKEKIKNNKKYKLIVIGTGSTGSGIVYQCRAAGWKVAIIDSRPFGGTCALRGCDPKKVLVGVAEVVDRSTDLKGKGIDKEPKINWEELMKFKDTFTKSIPKNNEKAFKKAGIDAYYGKAVFTGKNIIKVKDKELQGEYFVIATGAKPRKLNIPGEKLITLSDQFLELKKLPKDITFIGGGYISFELAHIAAMAGANVRILHRSESLLGNFDKDLVKLLVEEFKEKGIKIIINTPVNSVKKKGGKLIIYSKNKKFVTDMAVHGAGRVPNIENLNLNIAGVKANDKGILVNHYLQTSNPKIYSGGDVASDGLPLTPVAGVHGRIIAENLLKRNKVKFDGSVTASTIFTYPPLAMVGLTEEQAKKNKIKFDKKFVNTSSWYNVRRINVKHSDYKILTDKKNNIIGAHLLYPSAEDVINLFVLAMKHKIKINDFNYLYLGKLLVSGGAALMGTYLAFAQLFILKKWCEYCLASSVLSLAIFLVILL